jgi:hypothetical protein
MTTRRIVAMVSIPVVLTVGISALLVLMLLGDAGLWTEGSRHGRWRTVFTGFGTVTGEDTQVTLTPQPPEDGSTSTHAGLVVTQDSYAEVTISARIRTRQQLRSPAPNPWEVGWLIWHYTGPERFYALALKPNGWELTKQDPSYPGGQRFLATGTSSAFPVGQWHEVSVVQLGSVIKVSANGRQLASFTDAERPYLAGRVGLYTEDAQVDFTDVQINSLPAEPRGRSTG